MTVEARLVPSYTVGGVATLKPAYYAGAAVVCLELGVLVSKTPVSTDFKVYVTSTGGLVAKTGAAGAGERQVILQTGAFVT